MCQKYGLQERIKPSCKVSRPEGLLSDVSQNSTSSDAFLTMIVSPVVKDAVTKFCKIVFTRICGVFFIQTAFQRRSHGDGFERRAKRILSLCGAVEERLICVVHQICQAALLFGLFGSKRFGSKSGAEAMATIRPVSTSITTMAPRKYSMACWA